MPRLAQQIFHDFFYSTGYGKGKSNTSYDGNVFWSYATVIAQKMEGVKGEKVLLLSHYSMSPTTSGHISGLRSAVPPEYVVLSFPFKFGNHFEHSADTVRRMYEKAIEDISDDMLAREANRRDYKTFAYAYKKCAELFGWRKKDIRKALAEIARKDAIVDEIEAKRAKMLETREANKDENARTLDARKQAKLDALIAKFQKLDLDKMSSCELARNLFGSTAKLADNETVDILRTWMLRPGGRFGDKDHKPMTYAEFVPFYKENKPFPRWDYRNFTLVWEVNGIVQTSKGVSVSVNHVREAFRVFDSYEDKTKFVGYKIHQYTVAEVTEHFIVIGCHRIPIENINDLRKIIFKEDI